MSLIGGSLLKAASLYEGRPYDEFPCHGLVISACDDLFLFEDKVAWPELPEDIHEPHSEFDCKPVIDDLAKHLKSEFRLSWLAEDEPLQLGDVLVLRIVDHSPRHVALVSGLDPVKILHSWNPQPDHPELGRVCFHPLLPQFFSIHTACRISAA